MVIVCLLSMKPRFLLPRILEEKQSPLVRQLLDIIDQQAHFSWEKTEKAKILKQVFKNIKAA